MFKKNELEVMNVLWHEGRPLTHNELIACSVNRTWKTSTIHFILNGLLNKSAINVVGTVLSGKVYARLYAPVFSKEEYNAMQIEDALAKINIEPVELSGVFAALAKGKKISRSALDDLQRTIDELEKELE